MDVCVDGATGEILDPPDATLPKITEIEAVEAGAKALGPRVAGLKSQIDMQAYWTCDPAKNGVPGPVYAVTGRYWRPESTNECEVTALIDGLTGEFVRIDDPHALRLLPSKGK